MISRIIGSCLRAFLGNCKQAFLFLFFSICLFIILFLWSEYTFPKVKSISLSRTRLIILKGMISRFHEENNKYPTTLKELKESQIAYNPKYEENDVWFLEKFTCSEGIFRESNILDGQGGLYYNNETGEVRWNVTKPVKYYWKFYFGKGRNEIPSDW